MPEAKKLFKDEKVVYIKVAKGGQPICRWLEEWLDIAEKKGLDAKHRARIHKGGTVEFYQPILDQYQEMLKKHPKLTSVTFCWMQGERDANGGAHAAYKESLKLLISKLRRDLKRPDMNIVIGRIGDYALDRPSCVAVRKAQREIVDEDPHGAWVDVDDLNDRMVKGKMVSAVHYNRPEGYITLGRRFARQGHALVTGKEPAKDGRPSAADRRKAGGARPMTGMADYWVVKSQADWTAAKGAAKNMTLADGFAEPTADKASFQSVVKTFSKKRKLSSVAFEQSPVWDNWEQIDDITPPGAGNAYVFLPVAPGDYYFFATKTWPKMEYPEGLARNKYAAFRQDWRKNHPRGYHAWHSTDLKDWKLLGLVCPSSCMTTAEYADGKFYLYYDNPNDENPHLIIDDDLSDGVLGKEYGEVFKDPSHGSDAGIFRDEDGTFHMIYEDWSPINARENGWDSPLAGRVSSPDGIQGFKYGEHPPAVDHRTKPTGKIGTYTHPAMKISNNGKPLEYEIHEPAQNAYGDWTLIKVGSYYHLFGDYDSAEHKKPMRMARFHTDDLNKEFQWSGEIGKGFHPDPSVGFAEGKFYVIIQRATDFVSPGPWVDAVEARAGVDHDGDGAIDEWTDWQAIKETYSQKHGFARIVDVAPAKVDTNKLPAGRGFAFEYRTSRLANGVHPIMDRVTLEFE